MDAKRLWNNSIHGIEVVVTCGKATSRISGVVKYSKDAIGIHLCVEDVSFAIDDPVTG